MYSTVFFLSASKTNLLPLLVLRLPEREVNEFYGIIVSLANIAKEEKQHKASFVGMEYYTTSSF